MALPVALNLLGLGLNALGTSRAKKEARKAARAERELAKRAEEAGEFTAVQYEGKAKQERAIGSRETAEIKRAGKRLQSDARAVGASSGAGGYESTIADIGGEADYQMLISMYNSEQSGRDLELAAEVSRREGADAARGHVASAGAYRSQARTIGLQGAADFLGGASTMYERYGQDYKPGATV